MSAIKTPTGHEDSVHDAQLDYYGLRLATCSSDHVVKIFDVISQNGSTPSVVFSCNLVAHTGPVWEVAWAHPRWGTLLASCSYDASVVIHRQSEQTGVWEEAYRFNANSSVNTIEWCPIEYGLALALASSDGTVSILRGEAGGAEWKVEATFLADKLGLNSVSWAPFGSLGSVNPHDGTTILRIACGGCDEQVKIYKCEWVQDEVSLPQWQVDKPEFVLKGHRGWVRDVAFCPSVGLPYNLLATCSEDGTVKLWNQERENGEWIAQDLHDFGKPVWRLAWSVSGSLLAVSAGEEDVTLWKESVEAKKWIQVLQPQDAPLVAPAAVVSVAEPEREVQVEHKFDQFEEEEEEPVSEDAPAAVAPVGAKQEAWTEVPSAKVIAAAPVEEEEEDEKGWDDNLDDVEVEEEPSAAVAAEERQPQEQPQQQQQAWDEQQQPQQGWEGQEQPQQGWEGQEQPQQGWDEQQQGWEGQQQQGWEGQEGWEGQPQQGWEGQEGWDQQGWDQQAWDQQQQQEGGWEGQEQEWTPEQIAEWEQQQQQQQQEQLQWDGQQ